MSQFEIAYGFSEQQPKIGYIGARPLLRVAHVEFARVKTKVDYERLHLSTPDTTTDIKISRSNPSLTAYSVFLFSKAIQEALHSEGHECYVYPLAILASEDQPLVEQAEVYFDNMHAATIQ